jgi:hypothetical protein
MMVGGICADSLQKVWHASIANAADAGLEELRVKTILTG